MSSTSFGGERDRDRRDLPGTDDQVAQPFCRPRRQQIHVPHDHHRVRLAQFRGPQPEPRLDVRRRRGAGGQDAVARVALPGGLTQQGAPAAARLPHRGHDPVGGQSLLGPHGGHCPGIGQTPHGGRTRLRPSHFHPEHPAPRHRSRAPARRPRQHQRRGAAGRRTGKGQEQFRRRRRPCGQVDAALHPSAARVQDRHRRAGEGLQPDRVVLVGPDQRRRAVGQCQAESVGADIALAVAESGRQMHCAEGTQQRVIPADPVHHNSSGVGEHHAHRLVTEGLLQILKHLDAALVEQRPLARGQAVGTGEDRFDAFQRDPVLLAALPRTPAVVAAPPAPAGWPPDAVAVARAPPRPPDRP